MASGYNVTVFYRNIAGLYRRGGPGGGWIYRVSQDMIRASRAEAPRRSGDLRDAHYVTRGRVGNQYMQSYNIGNSAEHAEWVHRGTARWIYPDGDFLLVPVAPGASRRMKKPRVRGQDANPWLDRACTRVAIRYGAVPTG